ncbi:MAG: tyrosine-type recombinase/integrase [Dehalococcoidia bacterium]|nr:tyrosine-type recombinase/integrase [Dehalococcoidia bacterium]
MARGSIKWRGEVDSRGRPIISKGSWSIIVDIGKDASGKRKQTWITFRGTKRQAEERLTELLRQTDQGLPIVKGKLTLGEWATRWLEEDIKPNRRIRTYEHYESIVRIHIRPALGHHHLAALTPAHVKTFMAQLTAKEMAPAGIAVVRVVLHGALKAAIRQDLLIRNVVAAVPPPRAEQAEITPPDIQAVRRILSLAESTGRPAFPILHFLAYTGARAGEALGLTWAAVDLDKGSVAIVQSLGRARIGKIIQSPKTRNGRRIIDLDSRTVAVLRAHQGRQLLEKMQAEGAYDDKGYVFANALGQPLDPKWPTRNFQALAKQCGVPPVKLHSLRHFHASVLLAADQSIFEVSRRLGHASISTTADIYGHLLPGQSKKQADAFAAMMERA